MYSAPTLKLFGLESVPQLDVEGIDMVNQHSQVSDFYDSDSVKAMTENEFVSATGQVSGTGTVDPVAQRWAENFTENHLQISSS